MSVVAAGTHLWPDVRNRKGQILKKHAVLMLAALLLSLFGAVSHVSAQENGASDLQLKDLKGIDSAYQRTYTVDMEAMMASPTANPASLKGLFALTAMVIKFDSGDHTKGAFKELSGELEKSMGNQVSGVELQREDLKDLGEQAFGYGGKMTQEGMQGQVYMVLARKDKYIHLAIGIAMGDTNPKDDVVNFVKKMVDAKEGTDGIKTNDQGLRTGGLLDKLPVTDVPGNLKPDKGYELYPKDETGSMSAAGAATSEGVGTPPSN